MINFNRIVECSIGELNRKGIEIKELTMSFNVSKDASSNENKGAIDIYNLNESHRNWLDKAEFQKSNPIMVLLKAGYGDNPKQIYFGDIKQAVSKLVEADWITSIIASDGNTKNFTAKVNKSFKEGSTVLQAINYLADQLGIAKKVIKGVPDRKYKAGLSLSGFARDELDMLCRAYELQWFIEDNTLTIIPQIADTGESAIAINSNSGLIGSPAKSEKGVQVQCLLNGDFKVGRKVQMEARMFPKANYKIIEVNHVGNSREGDYYSILTLQRL